MTRPTLLLLHGALGAAPQLRPLADALDHAFDVHAVGFEGHGAVPMRDRPFRIEHFAENAVETIEARGLAPVRIFGYSMGGYVALHLAATRPGLVAAVATLGTRLAWSPEAAEREGAMLDAGRLRAKVPAFADALAERHSAAGWETVLAETRGMMRALGARPLVTSDTLAAIEAPVRLAVGDRDRTVSIEECVDAYRVLRAGELEVLPGTPHPLEQVATDRLARSLAAFFG